MNSWNAELYERRHAFVYEQAADLLELLEPRAGERILDLGCGTGNLTAKIAESGAHVIGIDASPEMIKQARQNYPRIEFHLADVCDFRGDEPFDAVFSNAALHWIQPPERAVRTIADVLHPGGRLVAEFGGHGNVRRILSCLTAAVRDALGSENITVNPWYFPSLAQYAGLLEGERLEVRYATLFDRVTPLDDGESGMANWLAMFGHLCLSAVPEDRRAAVLAEAIEQMRPRLYRDGRWVADYRRLRIVAVRERDEERVTGGG